MNRRPLGSTGIDLPEIGLGCMGLSSIYTQTNDAAARRLVQHAIDLGVRHFDTADAYGKSGSNERLVGRAIADRRDDVFVATKFGNVVNEDGSREIRGTPEYAHSACEASLERLGIDTIDLYYAHRIDPKVPIEETVGAMGELVQEGKVRWIGLSEAAPDTVRRGNAVHQLAAVQAEYSLWTRFAEEQHFAICEDLGIAYVAYAPIGRGFLSGTIKAQDDLREGDRRSAHPRFSQENIEANLSMIDTLNDVAVEVGASPAQVSLAWVLAWHSFIHVIPGTTSPAHLEENLAATDITLSDQQISRLAAAFEAVAGERYPAGALQHVQR